MTEFELKRKLILKNGKSEYADMCTRCLKDSDNSMYKIKDTKNYLPDVEEYD